MKPLRIVHCANFSESKYGIAYYAIDRKLSNGLIRNGHFVYDFSYREVARNATFFNSKKFGIKKTNEALLQTLYNIQPDLLLLGHSELITIETLKKAKEHYPHLKIAMWWVDPFENIHHIPERLSVIDAFFATTGKTYLNQLFGKNSYSSLHFFPNICDDSIELQLCNESTYKYDLLYIGRDDDRRKDFLTFIKSLEGIKLGMFGQTKINLLLGYHYYKTLAQTKIALNYSRFNDVELYSSDRIIQLTASGIMVMCPEIPHFKQIFNDNEVIYFDTEKEFEDKLRYYLSHDDERKEIAYNGYCKAHNTYNNIRITRYMLETIFEHSLDKNYEWQNERF